jgi:hypothetical protein
MVSAEGACASHWTYGPFREQAENASLGKVASSPSPERGGSDRRSGEGSQAGTRPPPGERALAGLPLSGGGKLTCSAAGTERSGR